MTPVVPTVAQAVKLAEQLEARAIYRLPAGCSTVDPEGHARLDRLYVELERRAKFIAWFCKYFSSERISVAIREFIIVWQQLQKESSRWSSSK